MGVGVGAGAGVGTGMGAGGGAGTEATESSVIPLRDLKIRLLAPYALLVPFAFNFVPLGPVLEPLSKMENVLFSPGSPLYKYSFHTGILTKSALSRKLMTRIHAATPLFSSISLLLIAHARNVPPSRVEAVRVVRAGWRPGSGQLELGG